MLVLPEDAVFTHLRSGTPASGGVCRALPEQVPVFAAVRGTHRRPRRPGMICSRLVDPERIRPVEMIDGLPVDSAEEVLLRCARDLGHLDLVVLIDSALALGHIDHDRMRELLASRRPGVRRLRAAYARSHPRAESGGETVLRVFHDAMDIPVEPQVDLVDAEGRLLGRADLLVVGTGNVHEYDGSGHRKRASAEVRPAPGTATGRDAVRPSRLHARRPAQPPRRRDARARSRAAVGRTRPIA